MQTPRARSIAFPCQMEIYKKAVSGDIPSQIRLRCRLWNGDKMQKLIVVAALVVCAFAAPLDHKDTYQIEELPRPSPINPDIPSDPKPAEKVTLISEAEEHEYQQSKADVNSPRIPTKVDLHREKRDKKPSSSGEDSSSSSSSEEDSSEEKKSQHAKTTKLSPVTESSSANSPGQVVTSTVTSTSSQTPAPTAPRRPYSPLIHQHNEHRFKPTEADTHPASSSSDSTAVPSSTTPVAVSADHANDKRDIPVPLTRKHHADTDAAATEKKSDATKPSDEEAKPENDTKQKKDDADAAKPVAESTPHPATVSHPIPVAELFAKKHPSTD